MQDNDIIVGLGGHIDHGKTTLIKALNGFDGDSLKEEKQRGITLDLSFSSLQLPSRNVAFIDVPGHEKLLKNMIAGAFGIDVFLLVIAANEGIMPQSLEHMKVANLLGIQTCICVITKIDKLNSPKEELPLLQAQIKALFQSCDMTLHSIIALSLHPEAENAKQIQELKMCLDSVPKMPKTDYGMFVYYIDRSFHIKGAGCVVSGSVLSGSCALNDKLYVYQANKEVLIKGIQIHDRPAAVATPSHRVAFNLSQINHTELQRGYLLAPKGYLRGFDSIDVGVFGEIKHNMIYQCYLGTQKFNAKVQLLDDIPISSHSFGKAPLKLATLKCDIAVFGIFSQHFILRSDDGNICGGVILNPIIDPIKKHTKIALLQALAQKDFQNAFTQLTQIHKKGFGLISSTQRFALSHEQSKAIATNIESIFFDQSSLTLYPLSQIQTLANLILCIFEKNKSALLSASSISLRYKYASPALAQKALDELLKEGLIRYKNGLYLSKLNTIKDINTFVQDTLYTTLSKQHFAPLAPYNIYEELDIDKQTGDNALKALSLAKKVVRLNHNLFITSNALTQMVHLMRGLIAKHGYVDVSTLREETHLSRKYLIGYLEYLDRFEDIACIENKRTLKYKRT
ncbi:selenocysteine-specific translation elongation factor [Helicobacter marmotae]|uniref:Selenocysteine-specific translation elongation factor n=1 Tax=Helicobacter marmotae TaxID=152490 RepID=A0A3D8I312_9HELI|nr:selenocysteine-specific translation elongation factor [Helicobacter marmotae]RDU59533.1 selenocysteine-specific translation elongation factor [Helicobacter marmotae]